MSGSRDQSMHSHSSGEANQQIVRIELGEKFKATLFALSIIVNVVLALGLLLADAG